MLSGVKRGKRRGKRTGGGVGDEIFDGTRPDRTRLDNNSPSGGIEETATKDNFSAADEIRRGLSRGVVGTTPSTGPTRSVRLRATPMETLASRGRIESDARPSSSSSVIWLDGPSVAPTPEKEDFRNGSRKGKSKSGVSSTDMTIKEMVAEERNGKRPSGSMSMDETYARNVHRLGSRYKGTDFAQPKEGSAGADEEDMGGDGGADPSLYASRSTKLTPLATFERERSRQIGRQEGAKRFMGKSWWWMEAPTFDKSSLIALGDYVTLVLAPTNLAVTPGHCYLVPIKHSESFRGCDEEIWEEVLRFRTCLRNMFKSLNKGVLFFETVLPSSGLSQARMEVVPVPMGVEQDSAMYFKSALMEQAEEWGTHTKLLSTKEKGLRRTVPKGFSYFYVEWNGGGFAQIIETASFPKEFGVDTIASMMELDPMRFKRKTKVSDEQKRKTILDFCDQFKPFDWTLQLDE